MSQVELSPRAVSPSRQWWFWIAAAAVLGANLLMQRWPPNWSQEAVPDWAVAVDLVIALPLAYLIVHWRRGRRAWLGALALGSFGVLVGSWIVPPERQVLWQALSQLRWLGVAMVVAFEAGVIALLLRELLRARRSGDLERVIDENVSRRFGEGVASRLLRLELRMWLYALVRQPVRDGFGPQPHFFGHRQQGNASLQQGFLWMVGCEIVVMHLILQAFLPTLAWIITALSVYGFAFMYSEYRATLLRPITFEGDAVQLRYGLLGDMRIPLSAIATVSLYSGEARRDSKRVRLVGMGAANVRIVLHDDTRLMRPFGEREIGEVLIGLDEPRPFIDRVEDKRLVQLRKG